MSRQVNVLLSDEQYEEMRKHAFDARTTVSSLVRDLIQQPKSESVIIRSVQQTAPEDEDLPAPMTWRQALALLKDTIEPEPFVKIEAYLTKMYAPVKRPGEEETTPS